MLNAACRTLVCLLLPLPVLAQRDTTPALNQLLSLSVEQLMNVKVVTASGFAQISAQAPSTITVLDVTKIQTRQLELNLIRFDIGGLIKETIASTQMMTKDRNIVFEARAGRESRPTSWNW